jgi:hypothetical protein
MYSPSKTITPNSASKPYSNIVVPLDPLDPSPVTGILTPGVDVDSPPAPAGVAGGEVAIIVSIMGAGLNVDIPVGITIGGRPVGIDILVGIATDPQALNSNPTRNRTPPSFGFMKCCFLSDSAFILAV